VHRNALECSRQIKPQISAPAFDDTPLRDAIELEMRL
jgi:hypothetical protein